MLYLLQTRHLIDPGTIDIILLVVLIIVHASIFGGFCAYVARSKNLNPDGWRVLGLVFGVFALIAVAGCPIKRSFTEKEAECLPIKKCPKCVEWVKREALVCKYCSHNFKDEGLFKE